MTKPNTTAMVVASLASSAIIAFAFYQRYEASDKMPAVAFYIAAAVICLLPVFYGLLRRKNCKN